MLRFGEEIGTVDTGNGRGGLGNEYGKVYGGAGELCTGVSGTVAVDAQTVEDAARGETGVY